MQKNVASQKFVVFAFNRTNNVPLTGDAANITANLQIDFAAAAATNDVNPTELEDGFYAFDATQAETNGDTLSIYPASSTSNIQVIGVPSVVFTTPSAFADNPVSDVPTVAEFNARTLVAASYFDPAADTVANVTLVATTTDVTNQVAANVTAISGGTTAAYNLELQYDTTGLTGETFPASQAQVGNLATGSAAISVVSELDVVTTAGSEVNTYAVTDEVDGVYHEVTDSAGVMELYYQFDVGGNGVAATCQMTGRLNSANDSIGVYAYNWGGAAWDQVGTLAGTGGTADGVEIFNLLTRHTGTGVNLGKVRVRGYAASGLTSATLFIDQAIISYAVVAQSVGYANGAIWFDDGASNTNTEVYVDGTADNPVSTEAAVNTLLASTGLTRVEVGIDSSITFATTHASEHWTGDHWTLDMGSQDVSGCHFTGADVSGIGTGTVQIDFIRCHIQTATIDQFHMTGCGYSGTLTCGEAGSYIINNGHSAVAGAATPIIDTGAAIANVNLTIPDWHNGIEIRNLNATGTDLFSISGIGQIIYAASSSGAVNQRGRFKVTNTGGVTITYDDPSQNEIDTLADTNELQTNQGNWLTATGFATETKQDIIDTNVDSILVDTADMQPKLGTPAGASMSADIAVIEGYTDDIGVAGAGLTDLGGMSTAMKGEILAEMVKVLTTQMTESYSADGVAPTMTQSLMLIQQLLSEFAISGTTLTAKQLDGSTTAGTFTLDDGTNPTSITRAT